MWRTAIAGSLVLVLCGGISVGAEKAAGASDESPVLGVAGERIKPSDYWIGVLCYLPEPALREQLRLPENQGLVVARLVGDSPAAKAGLQEHDVLLKAGDKPLRKISDLVEAVDAAKESSLRVELVRAGQAKTFDLRPEKRPASSELPDLSNEGDWQALRGWMERMTPGGPPMRFQFYHPGTILPPDMPLYPALPNDMSVTVTRQGRQPATIVVQKGDQRWEVSEKELDKLPAEIRGHVERMLTPAPVLGFSADDHRKPAAPTPSLSDRLESEIRKQFDKMNEQFEQLRKDVDELREQHKIPSRPQQGRVERSQDTESTTGSGSGAKKPGAEKPAADPN